MGHSWRVDVESVGPPDAGEIAAALALRNAFIASSHETVTSEDDTVWNGLISAMGVLLGVLDPLATAETHISLYADGLHPSYANAGGGMSIRVVQPGSVTPSVHAWSCLAEGELIGAELVLAQNLFQAAIAAQGQTPSVQDTDVFDALVIAFNSIHDLLDPSETAAAHEGNLSALVSVGSFDHITVSVGCRSIQPGSPPGDPNITVVRKPSPQSTSLIILSDISDLGVTLLANSEYRFEFDIVFRTTATANGLGLAINGPSSPDLITYRCAIPSSGDGTGSNFTGWGTAYDDLVMPTTGAIANADLVARIIGFINTGASGGILIPRVRSEVATQTITVQAGSHGVIRKLS